MTPSITNNKPIIQKIVLTEQQQQEVQDLINTKDYRTGSAQGKRKIIKDNYYHGYCHRCYDWPDYRVLYDYDGIKLVEYWCSKCMPLDLQ